MNGVYSQLRKVASMLVRTSGLGAVNLTTPQLISTTGSIAGGTLASTALLWAPLLGVTGPVGLAIAGAVTAVTALLGAFGVGEGCGQSCIQASNDANQIEQKMRANLAAYLAGQISQADALSVFDQLWAALSQACNAIGGGAGQNCISDRQQGACKPEWKAQGECWNWFIGYRDPIAQGASGSALAVPGGWTLGEMALLLLGAWGVTEAVS